MKEAYTPEEVMELLKEQALLTQKCAMKEAYDFLSMRDMMQADRISHQIEYMTHKLVNLDNNMGQNENSN